MSLASLQAEYRPSCSPLTKGVLAQAGSVSYVSQDPRSLAASSGESLEVYSLGRAIASEGHSGPNTERARAAVAIGQVIVNGAKKRGVSVTALLTRSTYSAASGHYGEQLGRYASTSRDPCAWHLAVAKAVLSRNVPDLVKGATKWNDPKSQDSGSQNGHAIKDAVEIIQKWTSEGAAWIGNISGISSYSLMFYRDEKDAARRARAEAEALKIIALGRAGKNTAFMLAGGPGTVTVLALGALAAFWVLRRG